jgi:hypothetical protein
VHLFRPSLGFLVEAQPRLENKQKVGTFWPRCTLNFLDDRTNSKTSLEKLQIYFVSIFFIY